MRIYAIVVAVALCALAGCAGSPGKVSPAPTGGGSPVGASTGQLEPARPVTDPCGGAPEGCVTVARADVDGDGALDAIGLAVHGPPSDGYTSPPADVTVRVATAIGVQQITVHSRSLLPTAGADPGTIFVGAFSISRPVGADLVLHTKVGGGSEDSFAVIGWGGGDLVEVPPPQANGADPNTWNFLESHGQLHWVTCDGDGKITENDQSAPTSEGIPIPGGGILESNHWSFVNGGWAPIGSDNAAKPDFSYDFDVQRDAFQCENLAQ
jgi:hypothetical protein